MMYKNECEPLIEILTRVKMLPQDNLYRNTLPPILDYDPVEAAKSLTIEDAEHYYKYMSDFFELASKIVMNRYLAFKEVVNYSGANYAWFISFFRQLERMSGYEKRDICPSRRLRYPYAGVSLYPPTSIINIKKIDGTITHRELREIPIHIKNADVVNKHRFMYISKFYAADEFADGYPAWYLLKQGTVFERYNEKTNKRVKVDFVNGEFFYYICGASDNWQEIVDVPYEIDDVVSALLFRNYINID